MEASLKRASDVVATLLNRRSGGGNGHVEPPREPVLPRDWPEQLPFRKRPKPYSRAIPWTPGASNTRPDRKRPYELFVSQSVLRQVRGHLITARSGEPYGFLIGQVVWCPWSETPYIVIDAVRRESQNLPPANDMDRFRHAWVAATRDARHRRGEVIGWYHRHGVLGLRLSEWDLHLQEEFFPEAWHCALIVASTSKGIIGGFIQRSPRARLFRKGLASFHELVDLDAKLVEGRKPSFVDWENYGAGEPVSVLKARWPAPRTRLERWKSPDHASEGEPPAPDTDRTASAPPSSGGRGLRGRSWRTAPAPRKDGERRVVRDAGISEEEFAGAVGPPRRDAYAPGRAPAPADADPGAPEGVEDDAARAVPAADPARVGADQGVPDAESGAPDSKVSDKRVDETRPAGRKTGKRSGGKRKTAETAPEPGAARQTDDATRETDAPADGAWYTAEFAEAVWGELPFGLEASEPSTEGEVEVPGAPGRAVSRAARSGPTDDPGSGAGTAVSPPTFELVPPFETEPSEEAGDASSLEWLVSLIGETLARPRAETGTETVPPPEAPATAAETAGEPGAEPTPATADTETGGGAAMEDSAEEVAGGLAAETAGTEAAAEPGVGAVDAPGDEDLEEAADERAEGSLVTPDSQRPPPARPAREPTRARPPLATPSPAKRRKTYVSASTNPDDDPEAEIPVVLFKDRQPWRPSPTLLRSAAAIAFVVLGALAVRAMVNRGPAVPPPPPATQPPSLTGGARPTPEFVDLADAYLSGLQSYRERLLQHELGQVDCERLTADFSVVVLSHRELVRYVADTPAMADRFSRLDAGMTPARERFEASGCPLPAELEPDAPLEETAGAP